MTRKKRNRGKTRAVTLAVIVILLAVITTGYAASRGALGPGAYSFMRTVFHPAEPASPPEGPPGEPPDSGNGEPGPEDQDPVGLPNREEPSTGDPTHQDPTGLNTGDLRGPVADYSCPRGRLKAALPR